MKIDTLCLSGGSTKGCCYGGAIKSLIHSDLLKEDLSNLKYIFSTSIGTLVSMGLLTCGINILDELLIHLDWDFVFDYNDLTDIFSDDGIFQNKGCEIIKKTLLHMNMNENTTMLDLYKKTGITQYIKVFNLNKQYHEYITHKNYPDLELWRAFIMSSCIPIVFKPIKYKNNYYIDGGVDGSIPYIQKKKFKNYLILHLKNESNYIPNDPMNYLNCLLLYICDAHNNQLIKKLSKKRVISISLDINGLDFNIKSELKKEISIKAYNIIKNHINRYEL